MKRALSILLALLLCVALPAAADDGQTISINLETATEAELLAAQAAIVARLSALRQAAAPVGEALILSGDGTGIQSGVVIAASLSRVSIACDAKTSVTFTGGQYDHKYEADTHECAYMSDSGTFDVLVESSGEWSITIEAVTEGGSLEVSGEGPYVGNFFDFDGATIVTITADASDMKGFLSNFIVGLGHQYEYIASWGADGQTNELFSASSEPFSVDVIIKPTSGRSQYFWTVKCSPGVKWSISVKQ